MEKGNGKVKACTKSWHWSYLNITVGHYNAHTDHLKQLLDYSKDQKYKTLLNVSSSKTSGM